MLPPRPEYRDEDRLPAAVDMFDRGVSLGVMSKAFGLVGLRIGWIASKDPQLRLGTVFGDARNHFRLGHRFAERTGAGFAIL